MASELRWIRSSYSGTGGNECLECASTGTTVWIRDSKDVGRRLEVSLTSWLAFVSTAIRT
ncbi:DUF397 domain-containing protein [Lentzea sp. BCCO 10_0798]|uniref:DUF397 domain-containing protein n=1 Tax=Lentzea kristufekii TaxID=3095430 RepID=A0ABU4TIS7_9PSEU|nr:DUF397 domain-containing protein [Lentzea sp. BCCO 10_0798]MDX8047821.1 DUF397 domain-containing protein [Lentzea sp. BCCO 10_0798]